MFLDSKRRLDIINSNDALFCNSHLGVVYLASSLGTSVLHFSCLRRTYLCLSSIDDEATSLYINCFSFLAYRKLLFESQDCYGLISCYPL